MPAAMAVIAIPTVKCMPQSAPMHSACPSHPEQRRMTMGCDGYVRRLHMPDEFGAMYETCLAAFFGYAPQGILEIQV
jgi:hypothetical protein